MLKGNFRIRKKVLPDENKKMSLEEKFEREAARKIGGSIAFVSKHRVMWTAEDIRNIAGK